MGEDRTRWDQLVRRFKNSTPGIILLLVLSLIAAVTSVKPVYTIIFPPSAMPLSQALTIIGTVPSNALTMGDIDLPVTRRSAQLNIRYELHPDAQGPIAIQSIVAQCHPFNIKEEHPEITFTAQDSPAYGTSEPDIFNVAFLEGGIDITKTSPEGQSILIEGSDLVATSPRQVIVLNTEDERQHLIDVNVSNFSSTDCIFSMLHLVDYHGERNNVLTESFLILR